MFPDSSLIITDGRIGERPMIQIRWQQETYRHPKTLQCRVMENPEEIGIQDPIWSEWANVPTFIDGKNYSPLKFVGSDQ